MVKRTVKKILLIGLLFICVAPSARQASVTGFITRAAPPEVVVEEPVPVIEEQPIAENPPPPSHLSRMTSDELHDEMTGPPSPPPIQILETESLVSEPFSGPPVPPLLVGPPVPPLLVGPPVPPPGVEQLNLSNYAPSSKKSSVTIMDMLLLKGK